MMSMAWEEIDSYWRAVPVLEAQEILANLRVVDFPHMKKEARKIYHRAVSRQADPKINVPVDNLTTEQLAERLTAALRG
jgi:hypothetical protein